MSMLSIFNVSGSAASAQSQRLNVVASNLANADTVAGPNGEAYKARQVQFQTQLMGASGNDPTAAGVRVGSVSEDATPGRRVHDPKHPSADAEGYVTYSNVNAVEEMVNMISASRSYQNNLEVMNTAKTLLLKTLQLGQGLIGTVMAITTATNTASGVSVVSQPTATAASDAASTSDRFLRLLVAQMQNQDPLSPMDNAQVTSQMAQINTVSGIEKLNTTVAGLSTQFMQLQAVQGASLVGHDVVVAGNRLAIDAETASGQGGFELSGPADAVKIEILAPSGAVMQTLNLGAESAGVHSFAWPAGAATDGSGLTFRASATRGGVATPVTTLMRDRVEAVSTSGNSFNLELRNSGTVAYGAVKAFN